MIHTPQILQSDFKRKPFGTSELQQFSGSVVSSSVQEPKDPESPEAIGYRLELTRIALDRGNATAFAKTLGISPQSWSNYVTGDNRIGLDSALRMVKLYSVTLDWIFRGNTYGMPGEMLDRIAKAKVCLEKEASQSGSKSRQTPKKS